MDGIQTIAESLAIAVLKGDMTAAYVLADKLIEQSEETQQSRAIKEAATRQHRTANDGFSVYRWPEFEAFAKRLGFMWDLRTIDVTIKIHRGEMVVIDQTYAGSDIPSGG